MRKTVLLLGAGVKAGQINSLNKIINQKNIVDFTLDNWKRNSIEAGLEKEVDDVLENKRTTLGVQLFIKFKLKPIFPESFWHDFIRKPKGGYLIQSKKRRNDFLDNYATMIEETYAKVADIIINIVDTYSSVLEIPSLSIGDNYKKTIIIGPNRYVSGKYIFDGYTGAYLRSRNFSSKSNFVSAIPFNKIAFANHEILKKEVKIELPDYYDTKINKYKELSLVLDKHTYINHRDIDPNIIESILTIDPLLRAPRLSGHRIKNTCIKSILGCILPKKDTFLSVIKDLYNSKDFSWDTERFYEGVIENSKKSFKANMTDYTPTIDNINAYILITNHIYFKINDNFNKTHATPHIEMVERTKDDIFFIRGRKIYSQPPIKKEKANNILDKLYESGATKFIYSYAYVKNKNIAKACLRHKKSKNFIKIDISKFYDSIDIEILEEIITRRYSDKVWEDIVELDMFQEVNGKSHGIKQGYTLSPIVSNIYLDEFDHIVKSELESYDKQIIYTRYSDDILISSPNKLDSELIDILRDRLGSYKLKVNESKVSKTENFVRYLGLTILNGEVKFSRRKIRQYEKISEKRKKCHKLNEVESGKLAFYEFIKQELISDIKDNSETTISNKDLSKIYSKFTELIKDENGKNINRYLRYVDDMVFNGINIKVVCIRVKTTNNEKSKFSNENKGNPPSFRNNLGLFIELSEITKDDTDKGYYIYPWIKNKLGKKRFKRSVLNKGHNNLMDIFVISEQISKEDKF